MKNLRAIAERIFLGRNSGNLAERFQDHLIVSIPLLLTGGFGAGLIPLLGHTEGAAFLVPVLIAVTATAVIASVVVVGYVLLVSVLLAVLGLTVKGAKSEEA